MRAEAERKWSSKMAARGGGGAHRAAQPSRDVVGRAKGQGQDQVFVKIQIYSGQSIFLLFPSLVTILYGMENSIPVQILFPWPSSLSHLAIPTKPAIPYLIN